MDLKRIASFDDLRTRIGEEIAVGDWVTVGQDAIDRFAEATGDHQWIHTDPERASRESPFGGAVAHGFLTASLLPRLLTEAIEMPPIRLGVNYGFNRLRFTSPVKAGARVVQGDFIAGTYAGSGVSATDAAGVMSEFFRVQLEVEPHRGLQLLIHLLRLVKNAGQLVRPR